MKEPLVLVSMEEALAKWFSALPPKDLGVEEIDSLAALNRTLAEPVISAKPIPEFTRSGMDGYAIRAGDTSGVSADQPARLSIVGEVLMGQRPDFEIGQGQAALIHTGGMLPAGTDAVVILENTRLSASGEVEVLKAVVPAENVIKIGEDVKGGQVVITAGRRLRAGEIGGLMALGQMRVRVIRKPIIGIISGGDEVIEPDREPQIGQIRDVNSYTMSAQIEEWGGQPLRLGIVPDDDNAMRIAVSSGLERCDAVLISAGSSASERDHTEQIIAEMGQPGVLVHGIRIKPGKPTILAVCDGKPVVGIPGNPVSAVVIMRFFIKPLIEKLLGDGSFPVDPSIRARLVMDARADAFRDSWQPVRLSQTPEGVMAEPIPFKSNMILSFSRGDGIIMVPASKSGLPAGTEVDVYLM